MREWFTLYQRVAKTQDKVNYNWDVQHVLNKNSANMMLNCDQDIKVKKR